MASQFTILAIVALVVLPSVALATQWTVGDDKGWTNINSNYTEWAQDKVFRVGDSLLFNYHVGNHSVCKVNQTEFQACNIPNGALITGHDVIPLSTPGVKWYICGVGQHCQTFHQKLKINVLDVEGPAAPPSADRPSGAGALISSSFKILAAAVIALVLVTV